jgi:hypothetical protein
VRKPATIQCLIEGGTIMLNGSAGSAKRVLRQLWCPPDVIDANDEITKAVWCLNRGLNQFDHHLRNIKSLKRVLGGASPPPKVFLNNLLLASLLP